SRSHSGEHSEAARIRSATGSCMLVCARYLTIGLSMPTIYISDSGDDKNDGLSLQTAVYSLKRANELDAGRSDYSWHFGPRAWKRIRKELSEKKKKKN